jgi:L-threonine kinase
MRGSATVLIPGTCGELIQGWHHAWAEPVLASCPIALYSQVTIALCPSGGAMAPPGYSKSMQAARLALDYLGRPELGARLWLSGQLRPGRGMASSTADIVGVMAGISHILGQPLTPAELARLACQIEPSDSTMFADITALAYRGSARSQKLGTISALPLLLLDPGYAIDTLSYNAQLDLNAVRCLASTTHQALALLQEGLRNDDVNKIGAAATLSALSYQAVSYSSLVEQAQGWAKVTGAAGLVRAHSGSVMGLLFPLETDLVKPARWLATRFEGTITRTRVINGGYRLQLQQPTGLPYSITTEA